MFLLFKLTILLRRSFTSCYQDNWLNYLFMDIYLYLYLSLPSLSESWIYTILHTIFMDQNIHPDPASERIFPTQVNSKTQRIATTNKSPHGLGSKHYV